MTHESPNSVDGTGERPIGEHYLDMLDFGHLIGREVKYKGRRIRVEEFLDLCGQHAMPMLAGLEAKLGSLAAGDPQRYQCIDIGRKAMRGYLEMLGLSTEA